MEIRKLCVEYGRTPKVLMLGNGINRAFGFASWDDLIESIRTKDLTSEEKEALKNVPYPLQPVILTEDRLGTQMRSISKELSDLRAPEAEEEMLRTFATLPVDSILTANYTYELEKALDDQFKCIPARKCTARKAALDGAGKYSTEQLHTYFDAGEHPPVWHIHGEAARHGTMILGHYYYGKLLAKMQQYISSMMVRFKARNAKGLDFEMRSWLDYFMLGDVYIVGLGMALSELDLWWLVNCKKRNFPDRKVVLYKKDIKPEEKLLAEAYGVIVETDSFEGDYPAYYQWVGDKLSHELTE